MKLISVQILIILAICCNTVQSQDIESMTKTSVEESSVKQHDLKMYPKAEQGFVRYVISLPSLDNEQNHKVELFAGKDMEVDCNIHRISGGLVEKILDGWGYRYLEFQGSGMTFSTLMGCGNNERHMEFVRSSEILISYNSRLPIVIYVPEELEAGYKLWIRDGGEYSAKRG